MPCICQNIVYEALPPDASYRGEPAMDSIRRICKDKLVQLQLERVLESDSPPAVFAHSVR